MMSLRRWLVKSVLGPLAILAGHTALVGWASDHAGTGRWSADQAWAWYERVAPVRGCNYLPRTAVNSTEMWQAETFDPATIDQEFAWAQTVGYNSVRVFLQFLVWQHDPAAFKERFETFLDLARRRGLRVMPVLFDDCAFDGRDPYLGPQDPPIPGVHNSRWTPSPGRKRVLDLNAWPELERYVKDVIGHFARDPRILAWDLYNEPGNSGMGEKSLPLMEAAFAWARQARPTQPLTVGAWTAFEGRMSRRMMELSDVVSFHAYDGPKGVLRKIELCAQHKRPLFCTEWLRRQVDNTFRSILPLFAKHRVGWFNWGLVAGKTQTYYSWGSKPGTPPPKHWQHDVFRPDGRPYDPDEFAFLLAQRMPCRLQKDSYKGWQTWRLENGLIQVQIAPDIGGRVIQFFLRDYPFLWVNDALAGKVFPPEENGGPQGGWKNYGGDKLWPAPQGWQRDDQWPGPPDPVLDGGRYEARAEDQSPETVGLRLTSPADPRTGIQFERTIRIEPGSTRVQHVCAMRNVSARPVRWGIWQVTQHDTSDRTAPDQPNREVWAYCPINPRSRYPEGYRVMFGPARHPAFEVDAERSLFRLHYLHRVGKVGLDTMAGWLAVVHGDSSHAFVGTFTPRPEAAYPDDASVEFWLNGAGVFYLNGQAVTNAPAPAETPYLLESEILSPLASLVPGESYRFEINWYAARCPNPILAVNTAGAISRRLHALVLRDGVRLEGVFGVFYVGRVDAVFYDATANVLARQALAQVTPLRVFRLDQTLPLPANSVRVALRLTDGAGRDRGVLDQVRLPPSPFVSKP